MNRRGFLQSCIALAAAPAIVRSDSLMRIVPRERLVWTATFEGARSRLVMPMLWYRPKNAILNERGECVEWTPEDENGIILPFYSMHAGPNGGPVFLIGK